MRFFGAGSFIGGVDQCEGTNRHFNIISAMAGIFLYNPMLAQKYAAFAVCWALAQAGIFTSADSHVHPNQEKSYRAITLSERIGDPLLRDCIVGFK